MTLALGLLALFFGTDLIISAVTKRPLGRLVFGYWDAPGSDTTGAAPTGGQAAAPSGAPNAGQVRRNMQ